MLKCVNFGWGNYHKISIIRRTKSQNVIFPSVVMQFISAIYCSQVSSREWRCGWSIACPTTSEWSVINNFIAYQVLHKRFDGTLHLNNATITCPYINLSSALLIKWALGWLWFQYALSNLITAGWWQLESMKGEDQIWPIFSPFVLQRLHKVICLLVQQERKQNQWHCVIILIYFSNEFIRVVTNLLPPVTNMYGLKCEQHGRNIRLGQAII